MRVTEMTEPKLFGQPKYEVESLADALGRAKEAENTKPKLFAAALKLIEKRQKALGAILSATKNRRK